MNWATATMIACTVGVSNLHAQTIADSVLISLMPITWTYSFTAGCSHGRSEGGGYRGSINIDSTGRMMVWSDLTDYRWLDSASTSLSWKGNVFTAEINCLCVLPKTTTDIRISVDTFSHKILSFYFREQADGNRAADVSDDSFSYVLNTKGKRQVYDTSRTLGDWVNSDCGSVAGVYGVSGYLSIGGGMALERVSNSENILSGQFSLISLPNAIIFFFPAHVVQSIRIFDLLGRERDAIQIATGSESLEYDASRLTPGMYLATLGGSAVKFIVR